MKTGYFPTANLLAFKAETLMFEYKESKQNRKKIPFTNAPWKKTETFEVTLQLIDYSSNHWPSFAQILRIASE